MTQPKPIASLGATLLARKGGAKPAMRVQAAWPSQSAAAIAHDLEDLGWNDLGDDAEERDTPVLSLTPARHAPEASGEPEVLRQQRAIADAVDVMPPAGLRAADDSRRAAFTLRLDAQRHLKLRLASTIKNRSAQALVTQALDTFLASIPELEALTAQLKRK